MHRALLFDFDEAKQRQGRHNLSRTKRSSNTKRGRRSGLGSSAEFNRLRAEITRAGNIFTGVASFKQTSDVGRIRKLLPELLKHPAYRQIIWPNAKPISPKQLISAGLPCFCSFEIEAEWMIQTLIVQSDTINCFIHAKARCEALYLLGDTAALLEELDRFEEKFGFSLWLAESRINALQLQSGFSAQKEYTSAIASDRSIYYLSRYLISWLSFRSEENLSSAEFKRLVDEAMPDDIQIYGFVHAALGTAKAFTPEVAALTLSHSDRLPPVDRYRFFLTAIQAAITKDKDLSLEIILPSLKLLGEVILDPHLHRILSILGSHTSTSTSALMNPIINAYANGNYIDAIIAAETRIVPEACVESLLIAVRASVLRDVRYVIPGLDEQAPLAKICADLVNISFSGDKAGESEARLAKMGTSNASAGWAATVELFLQRQRHDERIQPALPEQGFSALRPQIENPYLAYSMASHHALSYLDGMFPKESRGPAWQTVWAMIEGRGEANFEVAAEGRRTRLKAVWHLRNGDNDAASALLQSINRQVQSPIEWLEAQLLLIETLVRVSDYENACAISADSILMSAYVSRRLPLRKLVDELASWDEGADRSALVLGSLPIVLILEIYSRHLGSDRDELKSDAFIDYLAREGVSRPSEIIFSADEKPDRIIHFYRFVCVPDMLDQCLALKSTKEVEDERAKIIVKCVDLHVAIDRAAPAELQDELQQIRTQQVIRNTSFELDQSKIFVDVEGIQISLGSTMRENWNRYRILGIEELSGSLDDIVKSLEDALGRKIAVLSATVPVTERNRLLRRMFGEIRDQFSTSKLFGLDANLSTNVRHGYILRELRGPFVAAYLVTNLVNEESGYRPNRHWTDRLDCGRGDRLDDFSECLDNFSARVDAEIERLTRKKIKIYGDANPDGLFDFTINAITFQVFQSRLDDVESYEDFLRIAFELLWAHTQNGLGRVQTCLRQESLLNFNNALSELEDQADNFLSSESASAIKHAISLARPEIAASIERVANWFTLSTSREYQDYPLRIAFDVGVATVGSYFSEVNFKTEIEGADDIVMAGWTLPWVPRLFMLLIENAGIHAGIADGDLSIRSKARIKEGLLELSITNQLGELVDRADLIEVATRLNADFGSKAAEDFVQTEQGSGYPKLWKILRHDLRREHVIEVSVTAAGYKVDIMMNKDGIIR